MAKNILLKLKKHAKILNILKKGFDINHKIIDISDCSKILDSSLTSNNSIIPKGFYMEESMKETVVPNRNSIFMSFLFGYSLTLYKKFKKYIIIIRCTFR